MAIQNDTQCWRRRLPHLVAPDRALYITFVSMDRRLLDDVERNIALNAIVAGHLRSFYLYVAMVMPDHAHFIAWLYAHVTLPVAMKMIKRTSSAMIAVHRGVGGHVWQEEYFDHVVRKREGIHRKAEYVLNNPVRAGIAESTDEYPWKWRVWVEGAGESSSAVPERG